MQFLGEYFTHSVHIGEHLSKATVPSHNSNKELIRMDAIVGESYVSRTHSDRNAQESGEITERAIRKKRTNASDGGSGSQRTNYGVSQFGGREVR